MGHSDQLLQAMDAEAQERRRHDIAARLHFALLDGYLTTDEFEDVLHDMGILSNWRKERNGNHS